MRGRLLCWVIGSGRENNPWCSYSTLHCANTRYIRNPEQAQAAKRFPTSDEEETAPGTHWSSSIAQRAQKATSDSEITLLFLKLSAAGIAENILGIQHCRGQSSSKHHLYDVFCSMDLVGHTLPPVSICKIIMDKSFHVGNTRHRTPVQSSLKLKLLEDKYQ